MFNCLMGFLAAGAHRKSAWNRRSVRLHRQISDWSRSTLQRHTRTVGDFRVLRCCVKNQSWTARSACSKCDFMIVDTRGSGGSGSWTTRTSTWCSLRVSTSSTSCCVMIIRNGSQRARLWSTHTSVRKMWKSASNCAWNRVPYDVTYSLLVSEW